MKVFGFSVSSLTWLITLLCGVRLSAASSQFNNQVPDVVIQSGSSDRRQWQQDCSCRDEISSQTSVLSSKMVTIMGMLGDMDGNLFAKINNLERKIDTISNRLDSAEDKSKVEFGQVREMLALVNDSVASLSGITVDVKPQKKHNGERKQTDNVGEIFDSSEKKDSGMLNKIESAVNTNQATILKELSDIRGAIGRAENAKKDTEMDDFLEFVLASINGTFDSLEERLVAWQRKAAEVMQVKVVQEDSRNRINLSPPTSDNLLLQMRLQLDTMEHSMLDIRDQMEKNRLAGGEREAILQQLKETMSAFDYVLSGVRSVNSTLPVIQATLAQISFTLATNMNSFSDTLTEVSHLASLVDDTMQGLGIELTRHLYKFDEVKSDISASDQKHDQRLTNVAQAVTDLNIALEDHVISNYHKLNSIFEIISNSTHRCRSVDESRSMDRFSEDILRIVDGVVAQSDALHTDKFERLNDMMYEMQQELRHLLEMASVSKNELSGYIASSNVTAYSERGDKHMQEMFRSLKDQETMLDRQDILLSEIKSNIYNSKRNILRGLKQTQASLTTAMSSASSSCDNGNDNNYVINNDNNRLTQMENRLEDVASSSSRSLVVMRESLARNAKYLESFSEQLTATFESSEKLRNDSSMMYIELLYAANTIDMINTLANRTNEVVSKVQEHLESDGDTKESNDPPCCCVLNDRLNELSQNVSHLHSLHSHELITVKVPDTDEDKVTDNNTDKVPHTIKYNVSDTSKDNVPDTNKNNVPDTDKDKVQDIDKGKVPDTDKDKVPDTDKENATEESTTRTRYSGMKPNVETGEKPSKRTTKDKQSLENKTTGTKGTFLIDPSPSPMNKDVRNNNFQELSGQPEGTVETINFPEELTNTIYDNRSKIEPTEESLNKNNDKTIQTQDRVESSTVPGGDNGDNQPGDTSGNTARFSINVQATFSIRHQSFCKHLYL